MELSGIDSSPQRSAPFGVRLPPPVLPGDRVGVAALSGAVDPGRLEQGLRALTELGFQPVLAGNLAARCGIFAGDDAERLDAFHELCRDPSLKAIVFARGGHGMLRVLPGIDWELLARYPRAYVGYSDLTPFLLQVVHRLGLVAFHGPMIAGDFARGLDPRETDSFLDALAGRYPQTLPVGRWDRVGEASGPLLGGCLSLLVATLDTPFATPLDGAVLFWEEVSEPLYRIDRMLTHLRLSGRLSVISAMLTGHISWTRSEESPDRAWRLLKQWNFEEFSWPVASGLPSGHEAPNWTLPLGLTARCDPAASLIVLGEV